MVLIQLISHTFKLFIELFMRTRKKGIEISIKNLAWVINENVFLTSITFSGGNKLSGVLLMVLAVSVDVAGTYLFLPATIHYFKSNSQRCPNKFVSNPSESRHVTIPPTELNLMIQFKEFGWWCFISLLLYRFHSDRKHCVMIIYSFVLMHY